MPSLFLLHWSVISGKILKRVIDIAESKDIFFLSDETYRDLSYDKPLPAAASLSPKAISISSMSKCYGLPGIRIGWLASQSKEIIQEVLTVREQITITNNALGEEIAFSVLKRKKEFLEKAKKHVLNNFNTVKEWMRKQENLEWIVPEAGVVSFPRIKSGVITDPENLYRNLAEKHKTFVVPGRCFEMDNSHFRLGYGGTPEELKIGLKNLESAIEDVKN